MNKFVIVLALIAALSFAEKITFSNKQKFWNSNEFNHAGLLRAPSKFDLKKTFRIDGIVYPQERKAESRDASGFCGNGCSWTLFFDRGELSVYGSGVIADFDLNNRPWENYKTIIRKVTISNGITYVGNNAFYDCISLISVSIPASVRRIALTAFQGCSSLKEFNVNTGDSEYKSIDGVLFDAEVKTLLFYPAGKTDTSYTIPDSVISIEDNAFYGCSSLNTLIIPSSLRVIGRNQFQGCTSLNAFVVDSANPEYMSFDGVLFRHDGTVLLKYPAGRTQPDYCIPSFVVIVEELAFSGCEALKTLTIPAHVEMIEPAAFQGCSSLEFVNVDTANTRYCSMNGVLFSADRKTLIQYPNGRRDTSYTIPNSVTSIEDNAFNGCSSLTSVIIPASVTRVTQAAFQGCSSLMSINVNSANPEYKSLNGVLFDSRGETLIQYPIGKSDTSYTIPDCVTSIEDDAFYGCSSLTSVTIPASLDYFGESVFKGCSSLKRINVVTVDAKYESVNGVLFAGNTLIQYPAGKTDRSYDIPSTVTFIEDYAFNGCRSLTSVTIPASVTRVTQTAFQGCSSLTSINVNSANSKYQSLDGVLFDSRGQLLIQYPIGRPQTFYDLPNSVSIIGPSAFKDCRSLISVKIPRSVSHIETEAFYNCRALRNVCYSGTRNPGGSDSGIFDYCNNLDRVSVPLVYTSSSFCGKKVSRSGCKL